MQGMRDAMDNLMKHQFRELALKALMILAAIILIPLLWKLVAYIWGEDTLFDEFFEGSGTVIQQQVTGGKRNPVARAWETVFGAIGKVFGI